ncbi:tripartite tricarboxylate transporter TctB family protein [Knoellia sp. S7-12]|uniref:tripartite tricarboxylate transporter TctB family protein n=1 Tax=Knoellia sp. S7-12 TaxID=3126698 RepID=UPI003366FE2C
MSDELRPWLQDLFCGAAFLALGLAFAIGGSGYEIGSARQMGPGYLPLVLGGALAVLGLVTVGQGVLARRHRSAPVASAGATFSGTETGTDTGAATGTDTSNGTDADTGNGTGVDAETEEVEPARTIPWARGALVVGAILFFGLTIDGLGVIPTVFATSLLAALAGQHTKPLRVVLTAAGITVVTWLIFVVALQLRLPLFGDWVGG